jgi:glyoxylase-like metal-dependent hydrolase (beta-lactamase superfamily II)/rhodanese-related sulfurtransferase
MQREFPDMGEEVEEISPRELKRRLDDGEQLTLIDTRRPADFEDWQLTHPELSVVNVPFTAFLDESRTEPSEAVPAEVPDGPLVASCAKGISSTYVAEFLASEGYDVVALADGMEGWARLYERHPLSVPESDGEVVQLHRPSSGCLSYLFVAGDEAAVIDPLRAFATDYPDFAAEHGATIEYAVDTHVHADHVSGVRELAAETGAEVVLPAGSTARGLDFDARLIADGEALALGDQEITAVGLPGHTSEMTGYWFGGVLVSGDTVFLDSVARPDLEDGDAAAEAAAQLWETVRGLDEFPEDLVIAPGHVGPTTAPSADGSFTVRRGDLSARLLAFEESREEFVSRITGDLPPQPSNYEEIIAVNLGRSTADSGEAFELELGPNNCAASE